MLASRDLIVIYSGSVVEAELACSALNGHGIQAELVGQPWVTLNIQVVVRADQAGAAREVLAESGLVRWKEETEHDS